MVLRWSRFGALASLGERFDLSNQASLVRCCTTLSYSKVAARLVQPMKWLEVEVTSVHQVAGRAPAEAIRAR